MVGEEFSQPGEVAVFVRKPQLSVVSGRKVDVVFSKNIGGFLERQIRPSAQTGLPGVGGALADHVANFFFSGRDRGRAVPDVGAARVAFSLEGIRTILAGEDGCPQQVAAALLGDVNNETIGHANLKNRSERTESLKRK